MGTADDYKLHKMKISIFIPPNAQIIEQDSPFVDIQMYTGKSYEEFKHLDVETSDHLLFLTPGCNIIDSKLIHQMTAEIEDGVAIYYNYFVQIDKPRSKVLSFFDTYNKKEFLSLKKIIQTPVLVQPKYLTEFKFDQRLKHLHNFSLLLALTDQCMLRRSKLVIDGVKPINLDVAADLKILNEQSST